ncbi:hypothetical protein TNCV_3903591 [Trichonephila clavipes]|nr:hypothetical protein TNCV_3903591 [Trichonephila clavipes]
MSLTAATRGPLVMDLVTFNFGPMSRTTPKSANPLPKRPQYTNVPLRIFPSERIIGGKCAKLPTSPVGRVRERGVRSSTSSPSLDRESSSMALLFL